MYTFPAAPYYNAKCLLFLLFYSADVVTFQNPNISTSSFLLITLWFPLHTLVLENPHLGSRSGRAVMQHPIANPNLEKVREMLFKVAFDVACTSSR